MVPTSTSSETPGGGGAARPMGKTPISPLVWVSALSREFKEVTKPTSRSVASATSAPGTYLSHGSCHIGTVTWRSSVTWQVSHVAIVCQMAVFTWQLSHGKCLSYGNYLSPGNCLLYGNCLLRGNCLPHGICLSCMHLLAEHSVYVQRHTALAVFDQARVHLCNSTCGQTLHVCRCNCAWPMCVVQEVWKLS